MKPVNTFPRIATDETLRETVSHGSLDYPFQYYLEDIWDFDFHCIDWHWHPELEFFHVRSGEAVVSIGCEQIHVPEGWGMFINGRAVHRFTAESSTWMPNFVFSPSLLASEDSLIHRRYVQPLLESSISYLLFDPQIPWQATILRLMRDISELHEGGACCELRVLKLLLEIWDMITQHVDPAQQAKGMQSTSNQARLQIMLQFIHDHYSEPITLQHIADAVYISKSSALQIFQEGIRQSPVAYLIDHRLKCAAQILRSTEKSVASIAAEVGFANAGYFCRKFRELYLLTPNEYRKGFRR